MPKEDLATDTPELTVEQHFAVENARDQGKPIPTFETDAASETDDEAATITADADKPATETDKPRPKRYKSIQQEIDALTAQKHTAGRDLEGLNTQIAAKRKELEDLSAAPPPPPADPGTRTKPGADPAADARQARREEALKYKSHEDAPQEGDFEDFSEYQIAMGAFIAEKKLEERAVSDQRRAYDTQLLGGWYKQLEDARKADPNLDSKLDLTTPANPQMRNYMMRSPNGVAIMKHLSANKAEAQRISTLHPLNIAEEMGKLESRLDAASSPARPERKAITNAKPLPKQESGAPKISDDDGDGGDDESVEAHISRENKREGITSHR